MNLPINAGDCWRKIGTFGDRTCVQLSVHVHCRNCPVYSAGAARLLEAEVSDAYLLEAARRYAVPKKKIQLAELSVVIFRLGREWLALATTVFREVASVRPVHSLPHRRDGVVVGVVNIRGELLVCVSLAAALGLAGEPRATPTGLARLGVVSREREQFVFLVDEVAGLYRFDEAEISSVPATLFYAPAAVTRGMLEWRGRSVGVLDDQGLFYRLSRSLL